MLRIKISPLKPGVHEFDLEPVAEDLDLEPGSFENIRVHARLDVYAERILADLGVRADAALECDRTLQPFKQAVKGAYTVLFAQPEIAEASEEGVSDTRALLPGDTEIDITEAVRDTLLLSLPIRRIAPGAEDIEFATQYGVPSGEHGAVDPRWEVLRQLKEKEE